MHVKVRGNKVILLTQLTLSVIEDLPSIRLDFNYYDIHDIQSQFESSFYTKQQVST